MNNGKRSICLVTDDFVPACTGVGFHAQQIGQELARRGHRVSVITTRRRGEPEIETWNGVTVYRTFTIRQYGFDLALAGRRTIRGILNREMPDVIHYHWMGLLALRTRSVAGARRIRHVLTYHMTVDHIAQPWFSKPFRGLIGWLYARLCNRMDAVLAPSANMIESIRELGVRTPVQYLTNPVNFVGAPPAAERSPGRFKLLYVGQLNPLKNLPFLLQGFRRLLTTGGVDAELCIAGDGNLRGNLEHAARDLGISDRVTFAGFVKHEDLPGFYAAADVFVLPSKIETQGMVAMEAMRFGKPVLVNGSVVSARELVDHGRNGYVVETDSIDDLATKMATLARDPELCLAMGRESFIKSADYSLDGVVSGIEAVYARIRPSRHGTAGEAPEAAIRQPATAVPGIWN